MGQGAESCGGYEIDYNPYDDVPDGYWLMRDGSVIKISDMTDRHIENTISVCERASAMESFSCDSERWDEWVNLFEYELSTRLKRKAESKSKLAETPAKEKMPPRGKTKRMQCHCGVTYKARVADLNRGWGLSCSKRCAAIRRDFGRPAAREVE